MKHFILEPSTYPYPSLLKNQIPATRFITTALHCPRWLTEIEHAAFASLGSYFDFQTTCAHAQWKTMHNLMFFNLFFFFSKR